MESFDAKSILMGAWEKFKEHFIFLWLLGGVYIGSVIFFSILSERFDEGSFPRLLITILTVVFGTIVQLGCIKALLELVATNEEKGIAIVFSQYHLFWRYLVASILYQILVTLGIIFFIVPGIYFMLKYQFFSYALIDRNLSIGNSFKQSSEMTKGIMWKLLGFIFVMIFLNLAGALLLGIGLAVTLPLTAVAYTSLYFILRKRLDTSLVGISDPTPSVPEASQ